MEFRLGCGVRLRITLTLTVGDLQRERANLARGSVVGPGVAGLDRGALCDVELVFPSGERMVVPARAVLATAANAAFAFDSWDHAALDRQLAAPAPATAPATVPAPSEVPPPAAPTPAPQPASADEDLDEEPAPASVQEKLRGLSVNEQLRVARDGTITERIVLERLYGKVVWEALLRNTRVSIPEVARLAKMGTMPRPLLELIVGNPAWLKVPQVRRALLANPRLSQEMVNRVLQLLPRDELTLVPQITAYPASVRMTAKAMLKR
jgi:hypothetical protein